MEAEYSHNASLKVLTSDCILSKEKFCVENFTIVTVIVNLDHCSLPLVLKTVIKSIKGGVGLGFMLGALEALWGVFSQGQVCVVPRRFESQESQSSYCGENGWEESGQQVGW